MKLPSEIKIKDHLGQEFPFDTLEAFESFIKDQADFWSQRQSIASQSAIANSYIQKYNGFQTAINQINAWRPQLETWEPPAFNSNFNSLIQSYIGTTWLWSKHAFIEKWLEIADVSINTADAFFEAIVQKTTGRFPNGIDFFEGYVIAYEYANQGKTNINKRRKSEEKSLDNLRTELTTKQTELISVVSNFQSEINQWKEITKEELADLLVSKEKCLDDTNEFHSKSFHEHYANWTNQVLELQNQYREKLRFESPADYWGKKAKVLETQGQGWLLVLIASAVFGIILFGISFNTWLAGKAPELSLKTLEGVLLFTCLVSIYAFFMKSVTRLTFSSFHLMRDAEEREQLTHLYLSLREGKDDDTESRKIILQALFSRTDTGLLIGDHSPTMPTVQDVIKVAR